MRDLLTTNPLVFVYDGVHEYGEPDDERLAPRILDEDRRQLGRTTGTDERPPTSRWSAFWRPPKVALTLTVRSAAGETVAEFSRRDAEQHRYTIGDGTRAIATIDRRRGWHVFLDLSGQRVAALRPASNWHGRDYTLVDAMGTEIGWIADVPRHERRLGRIPRWKARVAAERYEEHVLALDATVRPDVRRLLVAASAAVYLWLESPPTGGDNG